MLKDDETIIPRNVRVPFCQRSATVLAAAIAIKGEKGRKWPLHDLTSQAPHTLARRSSVSGSPTAARS